MYIVDECKLHDSITMIQLIFNAEDDGYISQGFSQKSTDVIFEIERKIVTHRNTIFECFTKISIFLSVIILRILDGINELFLLNTVVYSINVYFGTNLNKVVIGAIYLIFMHFVSNNLSKNIKSSSRYSDFDGYGFP
ncbi:hypothetical protein BD770DRAFT_415686 [Pilaira anomala]|nr:hypothetical protein BD770DRAFT_415686 [Pilaira anomala]